jgi:1-phosphofructokinase family hexose kinase
MIYTLTSNLTLDINYEVDKIKNDRINKVKLLSIAISGKGINISRALNCLGIENKSLGFYGGKFKDLIIDTLDNEKIKFDLIKIKNESRVNVKVFEKNVEKLVEFNEIGPIIYADELESLIKKINYLVKEKDWFLIAGSLPQNINTSIYKEIIEMLLKKGVKVLLDASGEALRHGIMANPNILKINFRELNEINKFSNNKDLEYILKKYIDSGIEIIMLTNGPDQVIYYDKNNFISSIPPDIKKTNSTGCGDSVDAGIIYSILKGFNAENTLRFSVACGVANLLNNIPGFIEIDKINELMDKVVVNKLLKLQN